MLIQGTSKWFLEDSLLGIRSRHSESGHFTVLHVCLLNLCIYHIASADHYLVSSKGMLNLIIYSSCSTRFFKSKLSPDKELKEMYMLLCCVLKPTEQGNE